MKQHLEKQKLDCTMKISMDKATVAKLINQMHVMHNINYKTNLQIIKTHQNNTACYLALKNPWQLNLFFPLPFETLCKYFLPSVLTLFHLLFLCLSHRYMYTNPVNKGIKHNQAFWKNTENKNQTRHFTWRNKTIGKAEISLNCRQS